MTQENDVDILCVTAVIIDKLAHHEKICLEIVPVKVLDYILDLYKKHSNNK